MIDLQPHLDLTAHQAERILERWLGQRAACTGMQRLKGGLVNTVLRLDFDAPPHRAVLKLHGRASHGFAAEAQALRYLRAETACPVPQVFDEDDSARLVPHAFLLIEHVPGHCLDGLDLEPVARIGLERQLANVLAQLHEHRGASWGAVDAVDGSATWAGLFASRLADARRRVSVGRRLEPRVLSMVDDAIRIAPSWLADAGSPTLVHGDIWDGNLMVLPDGEGWRLSGLLDPDLQFADVETNWHTSRSSTARAMTSSRPTVAGTRFDQATSSAVSSTGYTPRWSTWPCSATRSSVRSVPARQRRSGGSDQPEALRDRRAGPRRATERLGYGAGSSCAGVP